MRITKVYTKTGDSGQTSLATGERVSKASLRVAACGDVDELNSLLGLACCRIADGAVLELLRQVQNHLFVLGADFAMPLPSKSDRRKDSMRRMAPTETELLEAGIDRYNEALPPLKEFILPGGSEAGALLHLARAVARRAERTAVSLSERDTINPQALVYLNRLSDLLFVLARVVNRQQGAAESPAQFH
ncbi:MAG: cob(I)yrinic acid a,c-diamide adenosyltransferase [Acidobacteria bacterium]|nr:cob(I)yrinic acid a,c-diamide adenosyltransferase [Acidobacteriota bacterium]